MKSGFDTLRAVFRAVTEEGASSRSEITKKTGISQVSVSKAVRELLDSELISSSGSISTGGRLSEFLCPSYTRKYLVINLCEKPFSYAVVHLGEKLTSHGLASPSVSYVNYLNDLDFCENVIILARRISQELIQPPIAVAIALPSTGSDTDEHRSCNEFYDHLGDDPCAIFKSFGIHTDIVADRMTALTECSELRHAALPSVYVSFSHKVYGVYRNGINHDFDWSDTRIDGVSVSDILKCYQSGERLTQKLTKFLNVCADIFHAKSILIDTNMISEDTVGDICDSSNIITDVTDSAPILSGLLSLLADRQIKELPSSHFNSKK